MTARCGRSVTGLPDDSQLQRAADQALQWSENNHILVNSDKQKHSWWIIRAPGRHHPSLMLSSREKDIERVHTIKLLNVTITSDLTWGQHVDTVHSKAAQRLYFLTAQVRRDAQAHRDAASQHAQGVHGSGEVAHRVCLLGMAHGTDGTTVRQAREHSETGLEYHLPRTVIQRDVGGAWTARAV